MEEMPYRLKQKLRKFAKETSQANCTHIELMHEFERYGVPYENLTAMTSLGSEPVTEGLAFISNDEGDTEDSIRLIEEVFLYFVNKEGKD